MPAHPHASLDSDLAAPAHDADIAAHTSPARARLELLLVGMAAFAVSLSMSLLVPVLPLLSGPEGLIPSHPSQGAAEWLLTSTLMAGAVAVPLFGRLGDMFGKRRMLIIATWLLVVGSIVSGVTSNLGLMVAGRAIQGMSMPAIPLGISLLAALLPRDKVGSAVALISAMLGVGSALALPIGGLVGEHADYHWLFWITAIAGESRMSSVFGLKVRPKTATVLPRASPPIAWTTLRPIARLRLSLTATTASTIRCGAS